MKALVLVLILATGCAAVNDAEHVLTATRRAEDRIGASGAKALEGVAALTSSLTAATDRTSAAVTSTLEAVAGVVSEARPIVVDAREKLENSHLLRDLLLVVLAVLAVVLVKVIAVHDHVKAIRRHHGI